MKTAEPRNIIQPRDHSFLTVAKRKKRIRVQDVPRQGSIEGRLLNPTSMSLLKIEREKVEATDIFHDKLSVKRLQRHRSMVASCEKSGEIPLSVSTINGMTIPDGYIPEDLSHSDIIGCNLIRQARYIEGAPFFHAAISHQDYNDICGFRIPKRLLWETVTTLNALRSMGNLFRKDKIHTVIGSRPELNIALKCYGSLWPAGINLYGILRELYPAFHARITGQIPSYIANHMDTILEMTVGRRDVLGIGRYTIDEQGRFLGLYPVARVPADQVSKDSPFLAQDQLGRKAIIKNMVDDILSILKSNPRQHILVIDYAGGVGNMAELLMRKMYGLPDNPMKSLMLDKVRIVVIDSADDQLAAGVNRFNKMEQSGFRRISEKLAFLKGDVTKPITPENMNELRIKYGSRFSIDNAVSMGMTSYTIGALDNFLTNDGTAMVDAMAKAMFQQCWKVYAVDFSSPMWRMQGFLEDTGAWGREYLRVVHGCADGDDERALLNTLVSIYVKIRFGLTLRTVADFVKLMALAPALSAHYTTVWPYRDGHNAGYCVLEDGTLKKPGILSFAQRLQEFGSAVRYKSKVWLVGTLDLGKMPGKTRAWAFIPGWMADFVIAENGRNSPCGEQP